MLLDRWMTRNKKSYEEVADEIGVTSHAVRFYCRGLRRPRAPIMARIAKLTKGEVSAADFQKAYRKAHRE